VRIFYKVMGNLTFFIFKQLTEQIFDCTFRPIYK